MLKDTELAVQHFDKSETNAYNKLRELFTLVPLESLLDSIDMP